MSSTGTGTNPFNIQPPPSHHIHRDSEVLPGARGAEAQAAPYDTSVTNDSQTWVSNNDKRFGAGTDTGNVMAGGQHSATGTGGSTPGKGDSKARHGDPLSRHDAFTEERPMGVQPTSQGGVAVEGKGNLPEGHANFTDKLIGKTQKIAGKAMKNPELHEKGELREAGGKQAALGNAIAPHD